MLRHEQQSIRVALATVMHHSNKVHTEYGALRGLKTATRARDEYEAPRRQKPPPPQPELFQEPGGLRPTGLVEPSGPQERVPRHTVEQMADVAPMVPVLDAPVPQMVDQLVDVLKTFDRGLAEQVIEVPRVALQDVVPQRALFRVPQLAEQLVDMPVPDSVILAHGRCDLGVKWCQIAAPGRGYWWMAGSRHVQWHRPDGFTASPGRYKNTAQF